MLKEKLERVTSWEAPALIQDMPHGDMPGDKIRIGEEHVQKATKIFPALLELLKEYGGRNNAKTKTRDSTSGGDAS